MDTTLRDGEQTSGVSFSAAEKLTIAQLLLEELNVDRIEIASARVSEGEFEGVKGIMAWAKEKGLYANTFETIEKLDEALSILTRQLASYNPEALAEMKKVLWEGTSHWDTLLEERAAITGKLVLSEATKSALKRN